MNQQLTQQIVRHIFSNLKIIESDFVKSDSISIINDAFLLPETIGFESDDEVIKNHLWGCQFSVENKDLKILVSDASTDKEISEFCALIHLDGAPMYGLYLDMSDEGGTEDLIACSADGKSWIKCSTFLEATFLAGMEQLKSHTIFPNQCQMYKEEYKSILSYLEYYGSMKV